MSQGQPKATPPSDYQVILPEGWFRILLDPKDRDACIDALIERQFQGVDNAPHLKGEVRRDMRRRAAKAYRIGGIALYLSLQSIGPLTIPASMLVSLTPIPQPGALPLQALADSLVVSCGRPEEGERSDDGGADRKICIRHLPAGGAVRVQRWTSLPESVAGADQGLRSLIVEYHIPVPRARAILLLTFSTPLDFLAEAMSELFDAIAASLNWTD
ncbi:hypothetical protein AAH978_17385 [Streptomyces sp. ZYX-F-203]